jgi:hypothetical protein
MQGQCGQDPQLQLVNELRWSAARDVRAAHPATIGE